MQLRLQGYSFLDIAKKLGCSPATARLDVTATLAAIQESTASMAERYRELELARLDICRQKCYAILSASSRSPETALRAVSQLAKLSELTAKLTGANVADKLEAVIGVANVSPDEAAKLVRSVFRVEDTHVEVSNADGVGGEHQVDASSTPDSDH